VVDVELVDLADGRRSEADRDRPPADDRCEPLALRRGERLGVTHARDAVAARSHDHGRGDDSAAGGSDADLVHADHPRDAVAPVRALESQGRDDHRHRGFRVADHGVRCDPLVG
jgi:hypothetical protein